MLRMLLGETRREDQGGLRETFRLLKEYRNQLHKLMERYQHDCDTYARYDIWTHGFEVALNELEESIYAAGHFRKLVKRPTLEEMDAQEKEGYYLHIYFYKNAIIRVFSVLDKLGYFMNDVFELHTEKYKTRFSYFSVLRRMKDYDKEHELWTRLYELKNEHGPAMGRLRKQRNMEIHLINEEMMDDLARHHGCTPGKTPIEDLSRNMADLAETFDSVCEILQTVFHKIRKHPVHQKN